MPEVQIAHLACTGSKFTRIALTYCFEGRKRHKHFVQPYRSIRRVNLSIPETTFDSELQRHGRYEGQRLSFSFVTPFSKDRYLALDTRVFSLAGSFTSQIFAVQSSQIFTVQFPHYFVLFSLLFTLYICTFSHYLVL